MTCLLGGAATYDQRMAALESCPCVLCDAYRMRRAEYQAANGAVPADIPVQVDHPSATAAPLAYGVPHDGGATA